MSSQNYQSPGSYGHAAGNSGHHAPAAAGAAGSSGTSGSAPPQENYQPVVRVMRLYKPGFHVVQTMPHLPHSFAGKSLPEKHQSNGGDCALSPFLLFPDSFGDIYCGERFSAYIAVVNGFQQASFFSVTLSVRLQTSTTVIDLTDTARQRVNAAKGANVTTPAVKTLHYNDTLDTIVQHVVTELGIHTLRVSVQYLPSPTSDPKTLRKFYRFNVLQPLVVQSSFIDINGKPMVQCEVTNTTKAPIFIEELSFVPSNKQATCIPITGMDGTKNTESSSDSTDAVDIINNDLLMLQTTESYGFAFRFTNFDGPLSKQVGYPTVRWCTSMGEFSTYRGEDTYIKGHGGDPATSTGAVSPAMMQNVNAAFQSVKFQCIGPPPGEVLVGQSFSINVRIHNYSNRALSFQLDCVNTMDVGSTAVTDMKSINGANSRNRRNTGSFSSNMNPSRQRTLSGASSVGTDLSTMHAHIMGSSATAGHTTTSATSSTANSAVTSALGHMLMQNVLLDSNCSSGSGLCFTGLTRTAIDVVDSGDYVDTKITLYALSAGLHYIPSIAVVDTISKERHASPSLGKVLVTELDDNDTDDENNENIDEEINKVSSDLVAVTLDDETQQSPPNE